MSDHQFSIIQTAIPPFFMNTMATLTAYVLDWPERHPIWWWLTIGFWALFTVPFTIFVFVKYWKR